MVTTLIIAVNFLLAGCPSDAAPAAPAGGHGETIARAEGADVDSTHAGANPSEKDVRELKKEMARLGSPELEGKHQWERKKNPTVAMLSSMALPGLGQLYNGRRYKTMLAAGFFTFYMTYAWTEKKQADRRLEARDQYPANSLPWRQEDLFYQFHKENARTFLWWAGAVWLISALDAFVDAHLYDVRNVNPTTVRGSDNVDYLALSFQF